MPDSSSPPRSTAAAPSPSSVPQGSPVRRFLAYVRPYWALIVGATLCGILKFTLPAAFAIVLRFMTDRLVPQFGAAPPPTDPVFAATQHYLAWLAGLMPASWHATTAWGQFNLLAGTLLVVYAVWGVAMYYRSYLAQLAGHRVMLDLRSDLFQHIQRLSHSFFQTRQSGGIVSRLTADIALAQNFVGAAMTNIWMDAVSCVFYLALLLAMDVRLTLAALLVFPLYIACMRIYGAESKRTSREVQEAMEEFSGELQERIAGYAVVKSFAAERRESRGFFTRARNLFDLVMANVRTTNMSSSLVQWLTEMATLGLIWYGGWQIFKGQSSIGVVVAFIHLLRQLYFPVNRISEMNTVLQNSLAAIERIFEVFDTEPDVRERPGATPLPRIHGEIRFDHVSFGYTSEQLILKDIDLAIRPGEVVALVGPSGAGKTTLVQLLPRFYDPVRGSVRVDGVDLREVTLRSLRSQIGIVAQDTLLFSGSVRDNILYGRPDASEGELERVVKAAHADVFIRELPEGYDTLLGERGAKLSGGQRQRIAIARAFLGDPRILILDEATSALDSESEHLIQDALKRLMRGRTNVVIAHRLSTVLHADRIVVLDRGRIVQVGPHELLLSEGGLYRRLYETQFRSATRVLADVPDL
ncbi:MAG TPA: ABC transporter ATP-binding protein [Burkholderiales bacterium]|nr:ABC transporter ATP-binding protein [Burkholderiales bacterium]